MIDPNPISREGHVMSDDQFTQFPEDADPVGLTGGPDGVTQYDVNDDGIADIAVTVHGDVMVVETNIDGTTEAVVYDQDVPSRTPTTLTATASSAPARSSRSRRSMTPTRPARSRPPPIRAAPTRPDRPSRRRSASSWRCPTAAPSTSDPRRSTRTTTTFPTPPAPTTTPWSSTPTTTARPTASSSPTSRARSRPTPSAIRRRASGRGRPRLTRARPRRRPTRATTPSPQRTTAGGWYGGYRHASPVRGGDRRGRDALVRAEHVLHVRSLGDDGSAIGLLRSP